jgi:surface antigen
MGNIEGRCTALCLCLACAAPVAAQTMPDGAPGEASYAAPPCRTIAAQTEIDGTMQQITGLACQQPDGTWQFVQGDENAVALYPAPAYPYYDPWYWGGFVTVVGGSFVFIDRFHHHHHMDHVHFDHASNGMGTRSGGWHGTGEWHGMGGMHGAGGGMHR